MKNTGIEYELFIQEVQQQLLDLDERNNRKTIEVTQNKKLDDRFGVSRQFDVYWEFELGGSIYRNVIECKDYNSKVSIDRIDAFSSKISDFPNLRGFFATRVGYQSGAESKAQNHGIGLLIIREPESKDWILDDGTPLVREISIKLNLMPPCELLSFVPRMVHKEDEKREISALTNEIFIITRTEKKSLYDIVNSLPRDNPGRFSMEINLEEAKLETPECILDILGYELEYQVFENISNVISLNSQNETKAYIEDVTTKTRKLLKNNGSIVNLSGGVKD